MKTGLVFSGGGARGAYQVGVWKALNELNIKCDIVVGTSIGSINSALYAQGDYQIVEDMWKNIDFNFVFGNSKNKKKSNNKKKDSIFSQKKLFGLEPKNLKKNIEKCLDLDKLYNSKIRCGMVVTKFPSLKMLEISKDEIKREEFIDYLIASSTLYPFFKLKKINSKKYIDGGLHNPFPIDYAKKLGADKIIAINISAIGKHIKVKEDETIICIKPFSKVGNPLDFSKENANKIFKYGYNDTMKKFNKLDGHKYTFKDLNFNFKQTKEIADLNKFIETIDYLGTIFEIDDTVIYNYNEFNNKLNDNLKINQSLNRHNRKKKNKILKILYKIKQNKFILTKDKNYFAAVYLNNIKF